MTATLLEDNLFKQWAGCRTWRPLLSSPSAQRRYRPTPVWDIVPNLEDQIPPGGGEATRYAVPVPVATKTLLWSIRIHGWRQGLVHTDTYAVMQYCCTELNDRNVKIVIIKKSCPKLQHNPIRNINEQHLNKWSHCDGQIRGIKTWIVSVFIVINYTNLTKMPTPRVQVQSFTISHAPHTLISYSWTLMVGLKNLLCRGFWIPHARF